MKSLPGKHRFRKVYIEISNSCNLRCSFCPQSSLQRPEAFMDEELFRSLLKQMSGRVHLLCLHVMGEPLYHPRFAQIVDIAEEEGQPLSIVSNGILLNGENCRALLRPTVHQINFSLQSFGDNFPDSAADSYLNKVFSFLREVEEKRPDMHVNLRLWNEGHDEKTLQQNKLILSRLAVFLQMDVDDLGGLALKGHRLKNNIFLNLSERFEWPEIDGPVLHERGTCRALKNQFAILADGTVVPCCFDREGEIALGNCHQLSLSEILSGDRAQAMRQGFRDQRLLEDLCQRCSYRERFS